MVLYRFLVLRQNKAVSDQIWKTLLEFYIYICVCVWECGCGNHNQTFRIAIQVQIRWIVNADDSKCGWDTPHFHHVSNNYFLLITPNRVTLITKNVIILNRLISWIFCSSPLVTGVIWWPVKSRVCWLWSLSRPPSYPNNQTWNDIDSGSICAVFNAVAL